MSDLLKRRGFLKLTTSIFLEDAENIAKAFGELCFIPTRVEHRFDRNEFDYSLGNTYSLNSWFAYKVNDWISFSARGEVLAEERINGANPNLNPMMVTTADTANSGGKYINGGLGFNVYVPKGSFKNVRFGFEYALPLYQEPNGIQLERRETLTFGLQYSL